MPFATARVRAARLCLLGLPRLTDLHLVDGHSLLHG